MKKIGLNSLAGIALGCAALIAAAAAAADGATPAGTLASTAGSVQIQRNGQTSAAAAGSQVNSGDLVRVAGSSSAQIKTNDNAIFELGSDTDFQVTSYSYAGNGTVQESRAPGAAKYTLNRGTLRTVTGSIGKQRGDNYMVTAPEADIRVHGTDYSAQEGEGLLVIVYAGAVTVSNDTGSIEVSAGQYVFVGSRHSPLHWKNLDDINLEINIPIIIRLPPIPASPS